MNEEKLEKTFYTTKKGKPVLWVHTGRYTSADTRYGYSSAVCSSHGNLTRIIRTNSYYTKVNHLVKLSPKCIFIQAKKDINDAIVEIFKVENMDEANKKVTLKKLATYKNNKWDDSSYVKTYKTAIHSTLMRAKKYYNLTDIK